ncbi:MAG: MBL fold metallo-hydrolase [Bacillota bacterium]
MLIKTLVENNAISPEFHTEHGLSLYVETGKTKFLFDMGASGLFLENARKLGVDIASVDFAVVSHGHYDHGGGLKLFLQENSKAKVFLRQTAFLRRYSKRENEWREIGLDRELEGSERLVLTPDRFEIAEGIELFSNVTGRELFSVCSSALMVEKDGAVIQDPFEHEQNLIVAEAGKTALFAGCGHNGIVNILKEFMRLKGTPPDTVFGGFHLFNPSTKTSESVELVEKIGGFLKNGHTKYYTGHCTGMESYGHLKEILGERLEYLATGSVIHL